MLERTSRTAETTADGDRQTVIEAIRASVHLRFGVDCGAFADRVLDLVRDANHEGDRSARVAVARLCLDDLYLATACARGDDRAWEECAARFFGFMRDFARRSLHEPAARDLADQVIADLWQRQKIGSYQGRSTLRTWLGTVIAHAAINVVKSARPSVSLDETNARGRVREPATSVAGDAGTEQKTAELLAGLITAALSELSSEEKLLILLYYEQGLTLDQMGPILHRSKAALSRRLAAIRRTLHARIEARARERFGTSAAALRAGLDLGRIELDIGSVVGARTLVESKRGNVV